MVGWNTLGGFTMRLSVRVAAVLLAVVLVPSVVFAQAAIQGVVRDSSGGVLPGVTVEAASPVLIEKVRSAVTDGDGRYQIIDLRPGAYTVTFTLTGFNGFRRDGVTLVGSATSQVDAELRVGALEETITVTGEAPVVDVQSTGRQSVLSAETIDALPSSRSYVSLARLIPGTSGGGTDSGGSQTQGVGGSVTVHGSKATDQRITLNGINIMTLQAGGNIGGQVPDMGSAAEVTVDTTSLSAELPSGGVRINFIPRDGGNRFSNSTFFTYSHDKLQTSNFTDELRAAGLGTPNEVKVNWDTNVGIGGPIKQDKVWFFFTTRYQGAESYVPVFENANAFKPNEWLYVPTATRGELRSRVFQNSVRLTWQASAKHKIAGTYKVDKWCQCPNGVSATRAPETAVDFRFPRLRQEHLEWTSPLTSRILVEAVGMHLFERWGNMSPMRGGGTFDDPTALAAASQMISVTEQSTGLIYRSFNEYSNTLVPNYAYRAAMAYVTGSHSFKAGFNRTHGFQLQRFYSENPVNYRFNNGVPNQITLNAHPRQLLNELDNDFGLYAQDRWNLNRMTINLALRYDMFQSSFGEQVVGPGPLVPARNIVFQEQDNLNWKDVTYRTGLAYDIFGTGKTAVKFAFNKYLLGQTLNGLGSQPNPINTLVNSTTRNWTDNGANGGIAGDFVPQCNLTLPGANGECGGMANVNFGTSVPGAQYAADLLTGFGNRAANWEFSASVQHEVLPRVSLDVGYYRRIWKNFQTTDDLALTAADFDFFDMVVPVDPRLPNGGGYTLTGLRNLKPSAFGRPTQNLNTLSSNYGTQIEHWNGVDVGVTARLQNGLMLQGGTSTGRTSENDCEVVAQLPELNSGANMRPIGFCDRTTPWLTSIKGYAVYTVPVIDVQMSGTFRSTREEAINANFTATSAYLAANSTLGRPLSGGASNITIALLEPNTMYLDRLNQIDLRFGKVLRFGRSRAVASVDVFNMLNDDAVLTVNQTFATWMRPQSILNARMLKFSIQYDF
jgi:hypothetical protein